MFVKETWHVFLTWSACSINLTTFFQGFGSLVSLRLQKAGRAKSKEIWTNLSHWNRDGLSSRWEDLLFFNLEANVQLLKRDMVTTVIYYYTTTEFHYAKRDSRPFQHTSLEVLALRSVIFIRKISKVSKFRLKCLLTFFPILNTSIR